VGCAQRNKDRRGWNPEARILVKKAGIRVRRAKESSKGVWTSTKERRAAKGIKKY
jgi:hypothetical protein